MRPIDADALQNQFNEKCIKDCEFCPFYLRWMTEEFEEEGCCVLIQKAPTIDAVPVVHDMGIGTSLVSAKDVDEWQDRIILAEGDESKRCKVYYAESLALIAHLKEKIAKRDELLAVMGVRIPEEVTPDDNG